MVGALHAVEESMINVRGCLSSVRVQKGSLVRDMAMHISGWRRILDTDDGV